MFTSTLLLAYILDNAPVTRRRLLDVFNDAHPRLVCDTIKDLLCGTTPPIWMSGSGDIRVWRDGLPLSPHDRMWLGLCQWIKPRTDGSDWNV